MSHHRSRWNTLRFALLAASFGVAACGDDASAPPVETCPTHFEVLGLTVEQSAKSIASQWDGNVAGRLEVGVEGVLTPLTIVFLDPDSARVAVLAECTDFSLAFEVGNPAVALCERTTGSRWDVAIRGVSEGETSVRFRLLHAGHADFSSELIPTRVGSGGEIEISGLIVQIGIHEVAAQRDGIVSGEVALSADGSSTILDVIWLGFDGEPLSPDDLETGSSLGWTLPESPPVVEAETVGGQPWRLRLRGVEAGVTEITFSLLHEDHSDFVSMPIPVRADPPR